MKMEGPERYLKLVFRSNRFNTSESKDKCWTFYIAGHAVGRIRAEVIPHLYSYPNVFVIDEKDGTGKGHVELSPSLNTFESRSHEMATVLDDLRKKKIFRSLNGWRNEAFDIWWKFSLPPLMKMERTATCIFGLKQCGVHINGYTTLPDKGPCMWIAKRSDKKPTWPGKLDQMAAGGLSTGETVMECGIKECQEEASIPDHLLTNLKIAGCISYMYEDDRGIFPECLYVMDLELPADFTPVNADGEVQSFQLIPLQEVKEMILEESFKYNSALVVLDFLIRNGYITPETEPYYFEIVRGLHDPLY